MSSGPQWALDAFNALRSQGDWWQHKPREEREVIVQRMSDEQRRHSLNARIRRKLEKVA